MIVIFIIGYIMIAMEHSININKAAFALLIGTLLWTIYSLGADSILSLGYSKDWNEFIGSGVATHADRINFITGHELIENLGTISSTLFFLLGAMTIVDLIDRNGGFSIITNSIGSTNLVRLMWVIGFLAFIMSSLLDNLTTTIIMLTMLGKIFEAKEYRWVYASLVVIAANAGGAWSPIGDVTTIMLWIGGQVTSGPIISHLLIPSFSCMLVATFLLSRYVEGHRIPPVLESTETEPINTRSNEIFILILGCIALVSVPVFKYYTSLPPYMGMLLGLALLWIITDRRSRKLKSKDRRKTTVNAALHSIDVSTILFFLGILSAVGALESAGHLTLMSQWLTKYSPNIYATNSIIGVVSSIVDNVPLVAASMGMYNIEPATAIGGLHSFIVNGDFWNLLAYCAGTGGSLLIIGSAAGVAAMGLEKISFVWYFKNISLVAFISYVVGIGVYFLQSLVF